MIPLIGYTNKLSARPGEAIDVKVSSTSQNSYRAELVRIISGDPNPDGPGMQLTEVSAAFEGDYPSRRQEVSLGSHLKASINGDLPRRFTLTANIWPTTPDKDRQGVMTLGATSEELISLAVGPNGAEVALGDIRLATETPLSPRAWYQVSATIDLDIGNISIHQATISVLGELGEIHSANAALPSSGPGISNTLILVAAVNENEPDSHFNGKIEAPTIFAGTTEINDIRSMEMLATWDFSKNIQSFTVPGVGPIAGLGQLSGAPSRAMTGSNWDGTEMSWPHAPSQYGAIHFHDDDIADANWETDFTFDIPVDLKSGAYAVKLTQGANWDLLPIFVCPPKGETAAKLCVVIPTFTYVIYANQARDEFGQQWKDRAKDWNAFPHNPAEHPEFGLSTYNDHTDGSGICHTTWHRPILNLRPGYHVFAEDFSQSGLRHLPADTHLLAWLHAKDIDYDVVTDWELHHEGAALLAPYKAVSTGSHPEYHTLETIEALRDYRDNGGKLAYLGGNGFYWRVALHKELEGLIEIRRAESGLRAWASEPGEYYNAFDGANGGTWRRNAKPPQQLVGVGYTVQGSFEGTYYRRQPDSRKSDLAWVFEGVDDDIIGDFGFSGGGAAGYELDRTDTRLGTPANVRVLATSENHPEHFVLPPEEWLTHVKTWAKEPPENLIRADMVYFDCPGGGAVFSVGSITFCGSLPTNNFNNNISKILENVIRQFIQ